ncbi:hypothetical protein NHX12_013449, partial [Muraenolepis orangiensis]
AAVEDITEPPPLIKMRLLRQHFSLDPVRRKSLACLRGLMEVDPLPPSQTAVRGRSQNS